MMTKNESNDFIDFLFWKNISDKGVNIVCFLNVKEGNYVLGDQPGEKNISKMSFKYSYYSSIQQNYNVKCNVTRKKAATTRNILQVCISCLAL